MRRSINAVTERRSRSATEAFPRPAPTVLPELLDSLPDAHQNGVWGYVSTRFGPMLLAGTEACLCWLDAAPPPRSVLPSVDLLAGVDWSRNEQRARELLAHFCAALDGPQPLQIAVQASAFQRAVWSELLRVPPGSAVTYGQLAAAVSRPGAARAVGTALAANTVALFIPCHRVVPSAGGVGQFRWGAPLKQRLLVAEAEHGCTSALLLN